MKFRRTQIIALLATIIVVSGVVFAPAGEVKADFSSGAQSAIGSINSVLPGGSYLNSLESLIGNGLGLSDVPSNNLLQSYVLTPLINGAFSWIFGVFFFFIGDVFLSTMGVLLNGVMLLTLNMSSLVNAVGIIDVTWSVIRNLSSILIIFFLLYVSIGIIIQKNDSKIQHIIVMVVIAGVLINFSLFFTKIAVDASNLVSLAFYRAITPSGADFNFSTQTGSSNYLSSAYTKGGVSDEIMQGIGIQDIFQMASTTIHSFGQSAPDTSTLTIVASSLGALIIMVIAALDFLAASILFAARIGILIILMAFSPFYFLGMIIPEMKKKISDKWLDHLLNQCFILPIYMLFMYVALRVITNPAFKTFMNPAAGSSTGIAGVSTSFIGLLVQFIIGIILVSIPLLAAIEYASFGKDWAKKISGKSKEWLGGAVGFAGGMAASRVMESQAMRNLHTSDNKYKQFAGGVIHGRLSNVVDTTGYSKSKKAQEKTRKDIHKMLGTVHRDDYIVDGKFDEEGYNAAQRASLAEQEAHATNMRNSPISRLMGVHRLASGFDKENEASRGTIYEKEINAIIGENEAEIEKVEKKVKARYKKDMKEIEEALTNDLARLGGKYSNNTKEELDNIMESLQEKVRDEIKSESAPFQKKIDEQQKYRSAAEKARKRKDLQGIVDEMKGEESKPTPKPSGGTPKP